MILLASLGIVSILVYVLIAVIVLSVIYWLIAKFIPEPLKGYATAIVVEIAVIFLIWFLLGLVNRGGVRL
jgi:hypothetical protein